MEDKRIISLVPSITETLCDLGLQKNIVGCTKFCVLPKNIHKTSSLLGGTKDPDIQKIVSLKPTHIIMNSEENTYAVRKELREHAQLKNVLFYESFPKNIYDSITMVEEIGHLFHTEKQVLGWKKQIEQLLVECKKKNPHKSKYAYFIWRNPWMVAGQNTYIANMLALIGYENVIITGEDMLDRYPAVEANDTRLLESDFLLFSSEPFSFKRRHIEEFISFSKPLSDKKCLLVDGQLLSWYGTRSLQALKYLLSDFL